MRDLIQKLIETETEATRLVQAARDEAGRIASENQRSLDELALRVRQQTRLEAEQLLAGAIQAAEREKRQRLVQAAAQIQTTVGLDKAARQSAVEGVIRCVCGAN